MQTRVREQSKVGKVNAILALHFFAPWSSLSSTIFLSQFHQHFTLSFEAFRAAFIQAE